MSKVALLVPPGCQLAPCRATSRPGSCALLGTTSCLPWHNTILKGHTCFHLGSACLLWHNYLPTKPRMPYRGALTCHLGRACLLWHNYLPAQQGMPCMGAHLLAALAAPMHGRTLTCRPCNSNAWAHTHLPPLQLQAMRKWRVREYTARSTALVRSLLPTSFTTCSASHSSV